MTYRSWTTTLCLLALSLGAAAVASRAAADGDAQPPQRYVYAVWGCTANAEARWRCDAPSDAQVYPTLDECQAVRERLAPRRLRGGGAQWWQCYRTPTWSAAEPAPSAEQ